MTQFIERWHVTLGVSGLMVGLAMVVIVSLGPMRKVDPTAAVVFVAIAATWLRGDLVHGEWWVLGGAAALSSTRWSERDGGRIDQWAIGMVLLAAVGLWATVPDTENSLLVGAILGPVLVQSAVIGREFGSRQLCVCLIALSPAAIWGAAGTSAGLLGSLCCIVWVVVAAVVVPSLRSRAVSRRSLSTAWVAQVITVATASRLVGRADIAAGLIVTVALVVCAAALGLTLSAGTIGEWRVVSSTRPSRRSNDE